MSAHIIPLNDEKKHEHSAECSCEPAVSWIDPDTNLPYPRGPLIVHNAFDCREISERVTGEIVDADSKWALYT